MSSNVATSASRSRYASCVAAWRIRLTMNPSISLLSTTGVRPISRARAVARSSVSSDVSGPGTISTRSITSTGKKKCMFTHRSGRLVSPASLPMPIVDELLASTASGDANLSRSRKIERLTSRSSNTASMTKSAC